MKRFQTKLTITFTTDATSKVEARKKFIMQVVNHINLTSAGKTKLDFPDKDFRNWDKQTKELPF